MPRPLNFDYSRVVREAMGKLQTIAEAMNVGAQYPGGLIVSRYDYARFNAHERPTQCDKIFLSEFEVQSRPVFPMRGDRVVTVPLRHEKDNDNAIVVRFETVDIEPIPERRYLTPVEYDQKLDWKAYGDITKELPSDIWNFLALGKLPTAIT